MTQETHGNPEYPPTPEQYSGMKILDSPTREEIGRRLRAAHETILGDPERLKEAIRIADSVGEIEGVTLLESGDYSKGSSRCAQYAFGERRGEVWAQPGEEMPIKFWLTPMRFLRAAGYALVERPSSGDVVAYGFGSLEDIQAGNEPEFCHFGIVGDDGLITSKLNQGPKVEHSIEAVSSSSGDHAYFFRRFNPGELAEYRWTEPPQV